MLEDDDLAILLGSLALLKSSLALKWDCLMLLLGQLQRGIALHLGGVILLPSGLALLLDSLLGGLVV